MATITGLTAARMLDIEAASIVDGEVVGDDLILTTHNGVQINAGNVRGLPGNPGADGSDGADASAMIAEKPTSDLPSTYPVGLTYSIATTATGWPTNTGTVLTTIYNINRGFQIVVEKNSSKMWFRNVNSDSWTAFYQIATTSYVDTAVATVSSTVTALDGVVKGTELAGNINLNTLITPGTRWQSDSADVLSGTNYPENVEGVVEVFSNPAGTMVLQRYTPYGVNIDHFWQRTFYSAYSGTPPQWSAWKRYTSMPAGRVLVGVGSVAASNNKAISTTISAIPGNNTNLVVKNGDVLEVNAVYDVGAATGVFLGELEANGTILGPSARSQGTNRISAAQNWIINITADQSGYYISLNGRMVSGTATVYAGHTILVWKIYR